MGFFPAFLEMMLFFAFLCVLENLFHTFSTAYFHVGVCGFFNFLVILCAVQANQYYRNI